MKRSTMARDYERSSGNVFADLGFRNPKQELLKAKLTVEIYKQLKARGVTQREAAKLLGTTQAQVSALMRCKPVSVSVGRLMEFLTVLGQDVKVLVKPAPQQPQGGRYVGRRAICMNEVVNADAWAPPTATARSSLPPARGSRPRSQRPQASCD